jgi:hypothetical protein
VTESTAGDKNHREWNPDMQKAIVNLKECINIAPGVTHFSPGCQCIIENDAFEFALRLVISPIGSTDKHTQILITHASIDLLR